MKLYIQEKAFSITEQFFVKDEAGNDKYMVKAPLGFRVGLKLNIYDMNGNELGHIDQKAFSFNPTFRVYRGGIQTATIVKKFTFIKQKYEVEELNWTVHGDFLAHEYVIESPQGQIMTIHKEWFSWGDSFVLDFTNNTNELEALAIVLAIDHVVDSEGNGFKVNGHTVN